MKRLSGVISVTLMVMTTTLGGLLLSGEAEAGTSVAGDIVVDTIWSPSGGPYWVERSIEIALGVTLTILEGVEVRFNGPYWFYVEGNLTAQGTAPEPITFTSNMSTPSPADWLNVMVNSTGRVHVDNATFSYGNAPFIFYHSENNTVISCTFHDNFDPIAIFRSNNNTFSRIEVRDNPNDAGMIIEDSQENQILNSTFVNNKYGIVLRIGASNNTITHNWVRNHSMFGVEAEAGSFSKPGRYPLLRRAS